MTFRHSLAALTLALACGSVLAATPAPAASAPTTKPAAPAKHKAVQCKAGEKLQHGKCEKPKA